MIDTYFYIPADRVKFINKIPEINATSFILDFEDSIQFSKLDLALENISQIQNLNNFWARPIIFDNKNNLDLSLIKKIINLGVTKFVLPKISKKKHLKAISKLESIDKCKVILLIESAEALNNIDKLLTFKKINIEGVALGSHDFVNDLEMKYTLENLKYFRQKILIKAKTYGIQPIDIASMDIKNKEAFKLEALTGFNMGYRSKMILHPSQIDFLDEVLFFNQEEIMFARKVIQKYPNLNHEIEALNFEGIILEKPHVNRILEIIKTDLI